MGDKPISFRDKDGNFVFLRPIFGIQRSWKNSLYTPKSNRKLRLERERLARKKQRNTLN